jgi:three-Cys-motif partner protein
MAAKYSPGDDGMLAENVGPWAKTKHKILTDYVQASGPARRKYIGTGAAYIDVFCGPGRSKIRTNGQFIDGSAVAAFKQGKQSSAPFTSIEISDASAKLLAAAEKRLSLVGAPVQIADGPAIGAIKEIVGRINRHGLHFAFLDPHNLGTLSFALFEAIAKLKHVDVLVHVSVADLQRNADRYTSEDYDQFDEFAPGWRKLIGTDMNQQALRGELLKYWSSQVEALGLPRAKHCELITGARSQRLYWLIFLARHSLAHRLWSAISSDAKSPSFDF